MSGLFLLTVTATGQKALVRARCLTCARTKAVQAAGAEGTMVWRDPAHSTCELIRPEGKDGLIFKTEAAQ